MDTTTHPQYEYDQAIIIGRFQPFHLGHLTLVEKALEIAPAVKILVGSPDKPRDIKNPFTAPERFSFISDALSQHLADRGEEFLDRVADICFLPDSVYNEQEWNASVQNMVAPEEDGPKVAIVGYRKDDSSYYLDSFPQYDLVEVETGTPMDATTIRNKMWLEDDTLFQMVPEPVAQWLTGFMETENFQALKREYEHLQAYRQQWSTTPHPVTFVTVDAVVVCKGHILLVKRGAAPGEGLWAFPGGFLKIDKTLKESVIEELYEETHIRIPRKVLENSITDCQYFDAPGRSLRGRTLTQAFLFELKDSHNLPRVIGDDDASSAKWVTLSEFYRMKDKLFEDHSDIGRYMLGRV